MSSNGKLAGTTLVPHPAGYELTVKRPVHPGRTEVETTSQPAARGGALLALWVLWSLVMFVAGVFIEHAGWWVW